MGPEDQKSGFPHALGSLGPLLLPHDIFFGELQSSRSLDGITLSHRIADSPPEEVAVHTHLEAHFVLVTSGHYVSSASAAPNRKVTFVYDIVQARLTAITLIREGAVSSRFLSQNNG
jgi:hypothetical protein